MRRRSSSTASHDGGFELQPGRIDGSSHGLHSGRSLDALHGSRDVSAGGGGGRGDLVGGVLENGVADFGRRRISGRLVEGAFEGVDGGSDGGRGLLRDDLKRGRGFGVSARFTNVLV